jgi:predicted  nucleic acid-binding Zn-ribbon protein
VKGLRKLIATKENVENSLKTQTDYSEMMNQKRELEETLPFRQAKSFQRILRKKKDNIT